MKGTRPLRGTSRRYSKPYKYGARRIKNGCQTNLNEISHIIEKLIKSAEKVGFEYDIHIELIMVLMRRVEKAGALIKYTYGLIKKLEKKCSTLKR